jgi:hypothetical protein
LSVKVKSAIRSVVLAACGASVLVGGSIAATGIASASTVGVTSASAAQASGLTDGMDGVLNLCAHGNYETGVKFVNSKGNGVLGLTANRGDCVLAAGIPGGTAWADVYGVVNNHWHYINKVRDTASMGPIKITTGGRVGHWTYSSGPYGGVVTVCSLGNYETAIVFQNGQGKATSYAIIPQTKCGLYGVPSGTVSEEIIGNNHNNWFYLKTKIHDSPSTAAVWIKAGGTTAKPTCEVKYY